MLADSIIPVRVEGNTPESDEIGFFFDFFMVLPSSSSKCPAHHLAIVEAIACVFDCTAPNPSEGSIVFPKLGPKYDRSKTPMVA